MLSIFDCLLKVYTLKAKGFSSYVLSCLFLQGSAAAELGCGGKFFSLCLDADNFCPQNH